MIHYIAACAFVALIFGVMAFAVFLRLKPADLSTLPAADPGDTGDPVDETNWQGE